DHDSAELFGRRGRVDVQHEQHLRVQVRVGVLRRSLHLPRRHVVQRHPLLGPPLHLPLRALTFALLLVSTACAHSSALEVIAVRGAPDDVKYDVRGAVAKAHASTQLEDVTNVWESLFAAVPPRFRTFDEAPPAPWPKELERPWRDAVAVCRERLGAEADLL